MKKFIFLVVCVLLSCSSKTSFQKKLEVLKVINLTVPESSGITVYNNSLYIVSDQNGTIYKTSLEGKISKKFKTKFSDLEGITFNTIYHNFWIANEEGRELVVIDSIGNFIKKIKIKGEQENNNSGLEGICFVESEKLMYAINEKSPTQLLQVNLIGEILNKFTLDFSKDISGICFDKNSDSFWTVSDESQSVININKKGVLISSYKIPVKKAEGIVIYNNNLYVVSDSESKLYVFKMPD